MGSVMLSAAVMTHPSRAQAAALLCQRHPELDLRIVVDPAPGETAGALRTAGRAWQAVGDGAAVALFPDSAVAFYSNWNSVNGAAARLAAAAGATWVADTGAEYFPTLAMVLPARHIDGYLEYAAPFARLWRDDDEVMREFLTGRGIDAVLSVPSLVQHAALESLAGNTAHGVRRAACFGAVPDGTREALAHSIAHIPWLKAGRVLAMVRGAGPDYLRRPVTELLAALDLDADGCAASSRRSPAVAAGWTTRAGTSVTCSAIRCGSRRI
jgi:hypothetical protein